MPATWCFRIWAGSAEAVVDSGSIAARLELK